MSRTDAAAPSSCTPVQVLPGHFYFTDLHTTDVDDAQRFYSDLLGWRFEEVPGAPNRYVTASVDGRAKGAITGLTTEQRAADVLPYWFPYLWVEDLDATLGKVEGLGGRIEQPAYDVFDLGRMAVVRDAAGASFGLWQDLTATEPPVKDEHGSAFWYELHSSDVDASLAFYRDLVGWRSERLDMGHRMTYDLVVPARVDDQQPNAGGVMTMMQPHRDSGRPSTWFTYFNVDDCDAAFARAQQLGAMPVMEPHDIRSAGRSCWVQDPQGALLALMTPAPGDRPGS